MYKKAILLTIASLLFLAPPALAANGKPTVAPGKSATSVRNAEKVTARLSESKLKLCQVRERNMIQQSTQLTKMATNMLEVFDKIADRVRNHYAEASLSTGKIVSGYDTLVTTVATKRTAVQTALATAQGSAESFACDSDNPKGTLTQFNSNMKAVKAALKDYRTAINKLIVAVRTVPTPTTTETE